MRGITGVDVDRINRRNRAAWDKSGRDRGDGAGEVAEPKRRVRKVASRELEGDQGAACYRLRVLHYRHRRIDVGNLDVKPEVDGIVDAGMLPDDSARYIVEESHEQVVIPADESERRVFVFTRTEGRATAARAAGER